MCKIEKERKKKDEKQKKTEKSLSIEKKKRKKDFLNSSENIKEIIHLKVEKIKFKQPRYQFPKDK